MIPILTTVFFIPYWAVFVVGEKDLTALYKSREKYYYTTFENKIKSIVHGNCTITKINSILHASVTKFDLPAGQIYDLYLYPSPISEDMIDWYTRLPPPKQMRVDPTLCTVVSSFKRPIFNNTACQLRHYMSLYAPRCQVPYIKQICYDASLPIDDQRLTKFVLPESNHKLWRDNLPPTPYMMVMKNVFVTQCGQVSLPCGFIHPSTNCHTTGYYSQALKFHRKCSYDYVNQNRSSDTITCAPGTPFSPLVTRLNEDEEVFLLGQVDDTYTYHIHLELVPRLVYYRKFFKAHPKMKIMYGCDRKKGSSNLAGIKAGLKSLSVFLKFFGIENPLIVQHHVFAHGKVYMTMEGACQDPVYNTWQVLYMRKVVLQHIQSYPYHRLVDEQHKKDEKKRFVRKNDTKNVEIYDFYPYPYKKSIAINSSSHIMQDNRSKNIKKKKVMILLQRTSSSAFTRNSHDLVRQWDDHFTLKLLQALDSLYSNEYDLLVLSDQNKDYMNCFECQAALLAEASVLIGMHGAGLGLMLYMPPNSAVIEIAPYANDGRCLLGAGPFSRLATLTSHNYMIHYPRREEFTWNIPKRSAEFNISRLIIHTQSFLSSIGFLNGR